MGSLPLSTRIGTATLVSLTAVVFALGAAGWDGSLSGHDLLVAAILGTMIMLAEVFDISFPHAAGTFHVSVGSPIALAAGLTLGPFVGGSVVMVAILAESIYARRAAIKAVVNVTVLGLVTFVGATVYEHLADTDLTPLGSIRNMAAVVIASVVFTLVNAIALSAIVAPIVGISPLHMLRTNLSGVYVQMLTLPTFGAIVPVLSKEHPLALAVLVIPLVGPFLAFKSFMRAREEIQETVEGLADALERRDPYTSEHSIRVTGFVRMILTELDEVPTTTAEGILAAARVHDLGKISVSDLTLNKPGALTPVEYREIQDHAAVGADMVARLGLYRPWIEVIRHHHERWDGRGYPDGLAGESIPLGARIIAVADAFDAMTSDRPYRKALDRDAVIRELRAMAGVQFDPAVVDGLIRALDGPPGPGASAAPVARPAPRPLLPARSAAASPPRHDGDGAPAGFSPG